MQKSILYALLVSAVLHNSTFSWDFPWQERSMKVFSDQRGQVIAEPKKHHDERAEKFMDVVQQALKLIRLNHFPCKLSLQSLLDDVRKAIVFL